MRASAGADARDFRAAAWSARGHRPESRRRDPSSIPGEPTEIRGGHREHPCDAGRIRSCCDGRATVAACFDARGDGTASCAACSGAADALARRPMPDADADAGAQASGPAHRACQIADASPSTASSRASACDFLSPSCACSWCAPWRGCGRQRPPVLGRVHGHARGARSCVSPWRGTLGRQRCAPCRGSACRGRPSSARMPSWT